MIAVWGLREGDSERWREELLAGSCKNAGDVEKVKKAAAADGFHSFRISKWNDGEKPDFVGAVRS